MSHAPLALNKMESFEFVPGKILEVSPQMKGQFERDGYIMVKSVAAD